MAKSTPPRQILCIDQQLGARIAFGPPPSPEARVRLRQYGYDLLMGADDAVTALIGGLLIRLMDLEGQQAERAA